MRLKEFNRNKALEQSINLFWKNGFKASAVSALVDATRVSRSSLYSEFGSKEGVLYASMDLYMTRYAHPVIDRLKEQTELGEGMFQLMNEFFELKDFKTTGCYMIHVGTEMSETNPVVKEQLEKFMSYLEKSLSEFLSRFPQTSSNLDYYTTQFCALFSSCMCFCLIKPTQEREAFIKNGIKVILNA